MEVKARYEVDFRPNVSDFYPPVALRNGEQGRVRVRVCFNAKGNATNVTVDESSGSSALNAAAVQYGLRMRFRPALVDFEPQGDCAVAPVVSQWDDAGA